MEQRTLADTIRDFSLTIAELAAWRRHFDCILDVYFKIAGGSHSTISIGDLYRLLADSGYDPKAPRMPTPIDRFVSADEKCEIIALCESRIRAPSSLRGFATLLPHLAHLMRAFAWNPTGGDVGIPAAFHDALTFKDTVDQLRVTAYAADDRPVKLAPSAAPPCTECRATTAYTKYREVPVCTACLEHWHGVCAECRHGKKTRSDDHASFCSLLATRPGERHNARAPTNRVSVPFLR